MDRVAVYAGTKNIYDQMYVCLKSLLVNNKMDRVYLLIEDDEFPRWLPENVKVINVSSQKTFLPDSPNYNSPWSYMAMLRCTFGSMFPDEHRILWLDSDTIVDRDITELFDLKMDHYFYAGALEPRKSKGLFRYINTGVLLINLDLIRKAEIEKQLTSYLNSYTLTWPDQDVINLLCQGRILLIDSEYNANAYTLHCSHPKIIHYAAITDFKAMPSYKKYEAMRFMGGEEWTI